LKSYRNAAEVLPRKLLEELQQYVQGVQIYVPVKGEPAAWGSKSGARRRLAERNAEIRWHYARGESIEALAERYFLSYDSLRKIVVKNKENSSRGCTD
jgi:Mor family transcriptional regulator